MPAETNAAVLQIVAQTKERSRWPAYRTLDALGVPRSVYYAWVERESLVDRAGKPCRVYEVLAEERAAICEFALQYPKIGYRKLTWMMVDEAVACVGESTTYRVLSDADLLSRWKPSSVSDGEYRFRPTGSNQQWHTDVMYVWVAARFYFLLSFIEAYSRYVVHHKLLMELNGKSVATELQTALENTQGVQPRVVHDHGSEFINRDVAAVIKAHNLIDIKTKPRHPESNGIVERFNGTVRAESDDVYGDNYLHAEAIIGKLMGHYNDERLHAALGYMTPATWHRGQPQEVREERARRIAAARAHRKSINQQRFVAAAQAKKVSHPGEGFVRLDVKRDTADEQNVVYPYYPRSSSGWRAVERRCMECTGRRSPVERPARRVTRNTPIVYDRLANKKKRLVWQAVSKRPS